MLFNSFHFLIFFPVVCLIYFLIPIVRIRNYFLLAASYYFYMNWEPAYAILLFLCTVVTFLCGEYIYKNDRYRNSALWIGIIINLSILFLFKYINFAGKLITDVLSLLHVEMEMPGFTLLLPVGISFFIFQTLGYMIDIYKKKITAETNFFDYALYVSFFPQLVAGPIERPGNLLPQFKIKHKPEYERMVIGLYWMLWGYFLKLVVADNCATYVDTVFNNIESLDGSSILLASFFFTFQIYGDFGGYSMIAIGAAKVIGFNLMENFKRPYFSTSINEFWRRWHISLSSWFRDYVYIPLGGNKVSKRRYYVNLFTTFAISGLWHGANYPYVVWGLYHGTLAGIGASKFKKKEKTNKKNTIYKILNIIGTFLLVMIGWMIFRLNNINDIIPLSKRLFTNFSQPFWKDIFIFLPFVIGLVILKDLLEERQISIENVLKKSFLVNVLVLTSLLSIILILGNLTGSSFIYFQF